MMRLFLNGLSDFRVHLGDIPFEHLVCFVGICGVQCRSLRFELEGTLLLRHELRVILGIAHPASVVRIPDAIVAFGFFGDLQNLPADGLLEVIRTLTERIRKDAREDQLAVDVQLHELTDIQLDNFRRLAVDDTNCGEMLTYRTIRLVALLVLDGVAITIECRNRRTYDEEHFRLRNEETITQLILDAERCELLIGHDAIEVLLLNFKNRYFCHFIT
nr:MAG TPA: hypothetical protein [Caudoviricetes sp.]